MELAKIIIPLSISHFMARFIIHQNLTGLTSTDLLKTYPIHFNILIIHKLHN